MNEDIVIVIRFKPNSKTLYRVTDMMKSNNGTIYALVEDIK